MFLVPAGYVLYGLWSGSAKLGLAAGGVAAGGAVAAMALGLKGIGPGPRNPAAFGPCAVVVARAALFSVAATPYVLPVCDWYFVPELTLGVAVVVALADSSLRGGRPVPCASAILLGLVLLASTWMYNVQADLRFFEPMRRSVELALRTIPETAVVGSWDAGFNAYWLRPRTTINLDGMVNSREYLQGVVRSQAYADYFRREGIGYLVNMVVEGPASARR